VSVAGRTAPKHSAGHQDDERLATWLSSVTLYVSRATRPDNDVHIDPKAAAVLIADLRLLSKWLEVELPLSPEQLALLEQAGLRRFG
jgi:hypothetical protein